MTVVTVSVSYASAAQPYWRQNFVVCPTHHSSNITLDAYRIVPTCKWATYSYEYSLMRQLVLLAFVRCLLLILPHQRDKDLRLLSNGKELSSCCATHPRSLPLLHLRQRKCWLSRASWEKSWQYSRNALAQQSILSFLQRHIASYFFFLRLTLSRQKRGKN